MSRPSHLAMLVSPPNQLRLVRARTRARARARARVSVRARVRARARVGDGVTGRVIVRLVAWPKALSQRVGVEVRVRVRVRARVRVSVRARVRVSVRSRVRVSWRQHLSTVVTQLGVAGVDIDTLTG